MNKEESDEFFGFDFEEEEGVLDFLFANDIEDGVKASVSCHTSCANDVIQGGSKLEHKEKRVELLTHKAGFDGVDQAKVSEILKKLEESSTFGRLKAKKDAELQEKIREQRWVFECLQMQDLSFVRSRVQLCINRIERKRDLSKYIVCVDMDAYYASIEERDNPALVSQPMGVGDLAMLCTANYTARKFGVRSGMPGYFAKVLCSQIVIVKPNFEKYIAVSRQLRAIFARYDPYFSAMSLDEAFLDITSYVQSHNRTPDGVVQQIRDEIYGETKLTASAGIAANKLLAKVCADVNKPNGQFRLANDKDKILEFLRDLPVRKICGIGPVAAKILNGTLNIHTCGELLDKLEYVNMMFSENSFSFYMRVALGIGSSGISTDYTRKSLSTSRTFSPTNDVNLFYEYLRHIAEELAQRLVQENLEGKTIAVIFKMQTFEQFTRQKALTRYISSQHDLYSYSRAILDKEVPASLRLLGIRITNLRDKNASNVISVKRYFAIKEDDKGVNDRRCVSFMSQKVDASISNPISTIPLSYVTNPNPVQDSNTLDNYEMPQLPSNREENQKSESSRNEQSSLQESVYLTSESQETSPRGCNVFRKSPLHKSPRQKSFISESPQRTCQQQNDASLQDNDVCPTIESQNISPNRHILTSEMRIPNNKIMNNNDSRIDNGQPQVKAPSSSVLGNIANVALITELPKPSISSDFENFLPQLEVSKVYSNTRKRALENSEDSEDDDKSSTIYEKRGYQGSIQQGNDNNGRVEHASITQVNQIGNDIIMLDNDNEEGHPWNCPICGRHFDSPTRMRVNSHLEACRAPRFPNTKTGGVRGRGRGKRRGGSQPTTQPTVTLYNFFPSSHR